MMALAAATLPSGDEWTYEVKWDGYRAQAVKEGDAVQLASRNLKNITGQFPGVVRAAGRLRANSAHLDGEIVAVDAEGRPSFQALHHYHPSAAGAPGTPGRFEGFSIVYYAFDLLHINGKNLTREPLEVRRAELTRVVGGSGLLLSEPLPGSPSQIESAVRALGLEGVVAKRRRSTYVPGRRSGSWIKVRFAKHQELVIGGFKPNAGGLESLIVGYYDGAKLLCAGKVRNGLTPAVRADLLARLRPLVTKRCPFVNLPSSGTSHWGEGITQEEMTRLRWVRPKLVAEVSFVEWTRDGSLRHAAFVGLRDDKPPRDVVREKSY
jgi:bifunctional non-homologous end joining protein LigD